MALKKIKIKGNTYDAWATPSDVETAKTAIQGTNTAATTTSIVSKIGTSTDTSTAATVFGKIAGVNAQLGDVEDALEYIEGGGLPSITAIAKQGTNASATLTATQAAVVEGNDTAISVSKEIRSEVGTGSDTAAESGTLFAVLKWVKDKVKSIFNLIGSPATGQPSTLFAAIAAGGGGGSAATPAEVVDDSVSSKALDPNKLYIFTNRTSNLTITLNAGEAGVANEYHFFIEVGSSLPTITFPNTITWVNTLTMSVNSNVEISILNDYAVWM